MSLSATRRFLGGKIIRGELGDAYVDALFENLGKRVPPESDLCCYWFEKARHKLKKENANAPVAGDARDSGRRKPRSFEAHQRNGRHFLCRKRPRGFWPGQMFMSAWWVLMTARKKTACLTAKPRLRFTPIFHPRHSRYTTATPLQRISDIAFMGDTKAGFRYLRSAACGNVAANQIHMGSQTLMLLVPWVNGT